MFIAKKLMACLHGGGEPQVGEVTSALFSAVSKRNEISWKYVRKWEISRKSVSENGSEIENRKSPNIRKF